MKPLFLKFEVLMEKKQEPSNETVQALINLESFSLILFNTKTLKHNFLTKKLQENLMQTSNVAVS